MALSYLRLQGFIKQMTKCSQISNYLSSQIVRSRYTSSGAEVVSSHSDVDPDQNLKPESNVNSKLRALSEAEPKTDNPRSDNPRSDNPRSDNRRTYNQRTDNAKPGHNKKLHHRILSGSEIEEEKKWRDVTGSGGLEESDSFGGMWKGNPRNDDDRDSNSSNFPKKFTPKNQGNKTFENDRKYKNYNNTFGESSGDRFSKPWRENGDRQRPERYEKKRFDNNRKPNNYNDSDTFGESSGDHFSQRPERYEKKRFDNNRKANDYNDTFEEPSEDHFSQDFSQRPERSEKQMTSGAQVVSSHSNADSDQTLEPGANINSRLRALSEQVGESSDNYNDTFGESSDGHFSQRPERYEKKRFDNNRRTNSYNDNFEESSDDRFSQRPERYENKRYDNNRKSNNYNDTFGESSDDRFSQRPERYEKKRFDNNRKTNNYNDNFRESSDDRFSQRPERYEKKRFDNNRKPNNYNDNFGKSSEDRFSKPWQENDDRQRPERYEKKRFDRKAKNEANTFGKLSDESLRPLLQDVGWKRSERNEKKGFVDRKARIDANTFGKMSDDKSLQPLLDDSAERFPDDESEANEGRTHIRLSKVGRYKEPFWYAKQITLLGKEGKVLEAIDMLEETMLKKDRVMPSTYVFNQLFGILGNVGYTKKAFSLFNKMKKMGLEADGYTYSCLFNCCSNSPWLNDGLQRTHHLHELIKDKGIKLHPITYKAMVKAYGVCGDIQAAFKAADEMCKTHRPDQQLYSFLLMACVSDTKTGLRHAIQVWNLMREMQIKPDLPLYNLLLRVIRDSGFGVDEDIKKFPKSRFLYSEELTKEHQDPLPDSKEGETDEESIMKTESISPENAVALEVKEPKALDVIDQAASLFGAEPVSFSTDLTFPENRLAAFGGAISILEDMKKNDVRPTVMTFTQIIDSLPQQNEAEIQLIQYMKAEDVPRDIDFYNMIIRRRNRRDDYRAANDVLGMIAEEKLFLNQRTFGCLAMGCTTLPKAKDLLQSINEAGLEPNIEIFGILAYKSSLNFEYKEVLLKMLEKRNIYPNLIFLQNIERSVQSARKKILKIERNETVGDYFKSEEFKTLFENFMITYTKWLKSIGFDKPEHPWKDFRHEKKELRPQRKDEEEEDVAKDAQY